MRNIRIPFIVRIKWIGHDSGVTTGELHAILRPMGIGNEHFIAHAYCCGQRGLNGARAAHGNGRMLWPDGVTVDTLNFRSQLFVQPGPAAGWSIGERLVLQGLDSGLVDVFWGTKTWLPDMQANGGRRGLTTGLCLVLHLLSNRAQSGNVVQPEI